MRGGEGTGLQRAGAGRGGRAGDPGPRDGPDGRRDRWAHRDGTPGAGASRTPNGRRPGGSREQARRGAARFPDIGNQQGGTVGNVTGNQSVHRRPAGRLHGGQEACGWSGT
ncbi:hypothetical protein Saso_77040 [Streptomyces asoensis]|uniref:Uncharacterized protein n=1 Tax=Streptomyces asoensis TaxID=249586 RepID=A0ABQ3SD51_9ACTN|nr:hypothetical protein Saso_77040 [Streptomyces asoensis]